MSVIIPEDYYAQLAKVESNNNPLAKAATSSASGLYQFTKKTWESLGNAWDSVFDVNKQNEAIRKLTTQNANTLNNKGISITPQSLYAAHFFGAGTAAKVLGADSNTRVADLVSNSVISANSFLKNMTVADFNGWLDKKMGNVLDTLPKLEGAVTDIAKSVGAPVLDTIEKGVDSVGKVVDTVTDNTTGAISTFSNTVKGVGDFLASLFNIKTWARVTVVVIGISLVVAAVWALVSSSNAGKTNVNVVVPPIIP